MMFYTVCVICLFSIETSFNLKAFVQQNDAPTTHAVTDIFKSNVLLKVQTASHQGRQYMTHEREFQGQYFSISGWDYWPDSKAAEVKKKDSLISLDFSSGLFLPYSTIFQVHSCSQIFYSVFKTKIQTRCSYIHIYLFTV